MTLDFLRSDNSQSAMRVMALLLIVAVCLNLLSLPILIYIAIKAAQELGWVSTYLLGLAGISGTAMAGKAVQKKFENKKPAE